MTTETDQCVTVASGTSLAEIDGLRHRRFYGLPLAHLVIIPYEHGLELHYVPKQAQKQSGYIPVTLKGVDRTKRIHLLNAPRKSVCLVRTADGSIALVYGNREHTVP